MCRVSCQIAKNWRRAGDLKSWHGSGTVKGGRWEILRYGKQESRVWEAGGSDRPVPPLLIINCIK